MDDLNIKTLRNNLYFLLPFAFMLHNCEEAVGMIDWSRRMPSSIQTGISNRQFTIAAMLFTFLGFLTFLGKLIFKTDKNYVFLMTGFAGMMFLNVFFPHLIATIIFGMYTPGITTALIINLPLTLFIFFVNIKSKSLTVKQTIYLILAGGAAGVCLIFLLLKIGEILS